MADKRVIEQKANLPFFPLNTGTRASSKTEGVFENEVHGGLSVRDHVALEFAAAMFSSPVLPVAGFTHDFVVKAAFEQADQFLAKSCE